MYSYKHMRTCSHIRARIHKQAHAWRVDADMHKHAYTHTLTHTHALTQTQLYCKVLIAGHSKLSALLN